MVQHTKIQRSISFYEYEHKAADNNDKTAWEQTEQARNLFEQIKTYEIDYKVYERQKARLESGGPEKSMRRSFIELFTTSKIGLGINTAGQGRRNASEQSKFRDALISAYDSRNAQNWIWDPIIKKYVSKFDAKAAHLFAYRHGQDVMNAIFGPMNPPELMSPLNGLMVCSEIEDRLDKGFFAIVPRLPDNPNNEATIAWTNSQPKEYKIRILNFQHPDIDKIVHPQVQAEELTWRKLDGANVEFRNDFRPRARYLYFHFCLQVLRLSWSHQQKNATTLKKELGRVYWGTRGRYLPRNMLKAFVEELGHEYDALLEGAVEDEEDADVNVGEDDSDETLLSVAVDQVKASNIGEDDSEDEDEDEDDEEEEEQDFGS